MDAQAWTLIGLLGAVVLASFGGFFYLGAKMDTRFDSLNARLDARIGDQGAEIRSLRSELTARIDAQGSDIRTLRSDLTGLRSDLTARIDAQGAGLGARIDALTARVEEHLARHTA